MDAVLERMVAKREHAWAWAVTFNQPWVDFNQTMMRLRGIEAVLADRLDICFICDGKFTRIQCPRCQRWVCKYHRAQQTHICGICDAT